MQTLVIDTNGIVKELDSSSLVSKTDLEIALAHQTVTIIKWVTGIFLAQGALIVALILYFKWPMTPYHRTEQDNRYCVASRTPLFPRSRL